ncbi:MAG: hypothetical protein ACOYYS_04290 [Chloroflexota bacterium]
MNTKLQKSMVVGSFCFVAGLLLFLLHGNLIPAQANTSAGPANVYLPLVQGDELPPASWIVFSQKVVREGQNSLAILNAVNPQTGEVKVFPVQEENFGTLMPHASRDGKSIVLVQNQQLKVFNVETEALLGVPLPEGMKALYPALSPDGAQVAFTKNITPGRALQLVNLDGSNLRQLAQREGYGFVRSVGWSPDGQTLLAQTAPENGGKVEIVQVDVAAGNIVTRTFGTDPVWSFDGSKIAYAQNGISVVTQAWDMLYTLPVGFASDLAWSPDGKWLAYVDVSAAYGGNACPTYCIKVVRSDGSGVPILILNSAGYESSLSWMP